MAGTSKTTPARGWGPLRRVGSALQGSAALFALPTRLFLLAARSALRAGSEGSEANASLAVAEIYRTPRDVEDHLSRLDTSHRGGNR